MPTMSFLDIASEKKYMLKKVKPKFPKQIIKFMQANYNVL